MVDDTVVHSSVHAVYVLSPFYKFLTIPSQFMKITAQRNCIFAPPVVLSCAISFHIISLKTKHYTSLVQSLQLYPTQLYNLSIVCLAGRRLQ